MSIEKTDFHSIFTEEGTPFYDDIFLLSQERFNNWVAETFQEIGTIQSFEKIVPQSGIVKDFIKKGYVHKESQCHFSAKAINILNPKYEYWTGFIHRQDYLNPLITHSFNLHKGLIIDFSRINNCLAPFESENLYLPHTYFGINIPSRFVEKYKKETFKHFSMNPLLFEWYKNENSQIACKK